MPISGSLGDIADPMWGSADRIAPGGSLGDLVGGLLKLPANLIYGSEEIVWGFGS